MNLSHPFIERPIATSLLTLAVLLVGLVAYPLLPVAPLPDVEFPTISVSSTFPGADPATMASSVATPLERQFSQIPGVTQLTSSSAFGLTQITIQFDLNRSIDSAGQDVLAAINAAGSQLPKNLPANPTYRKINPSDAPIFVLAVSSDTLPITEVDNYADVVLAQQISQITGIAQVFIGGEQKPAVRVQVDPARLAALGMGLEEVRSVLNASTVNSPKGVFNGPHQSFTIYDNGQLLDAAPYKDLIIAYRNGSPVRLSDVGTAIDAPENTQIGAWYNGRPSIQLFIFKQPGVNVLDAVERVKAKIPQLRAALPPSIDISILNDRTQTIRASVEDVQITMSITVVLVVLVIFLFLRSFWATVIPSIAVPMSLVGTCALMYLIGYSLDNLSLMALTIAVGFVVDDAIVMLENIYRHIEDGMPVREAAFKGAGEIGFTIISMSLSLVAVFIPVLLMGGIVGRLFREFAVTVTITILVSCFVSLTLTPMMCSRFLTNRHGIKHGRAYMAAEAFFDGMLSFYRRSLQWVLRHQRLTLTVLLITFAANFYLYIVIPKGFFPQQDTGTIFGFSEAAQDTSFEAMKEKQMKMAALIAREPAIESFSVTAGPTIGAQTYNAGRFWIGLKPRGERDQSVTDIIGNLRRAAAHELGIQLFLQARQDLNVGGRISKTQFQYTLQDASLDELNEWAPRFFETLSKLPELQDVATDQQASAATATLTIDRDTASRFGIQPQLIEDTLYDAFGQRQITQYFTQLQSYHLVLEVDPKLQQDPDALRKIYIKSPLTGQMVPLSAFVHIDTTRTNYLTISHQSQFPAVTLSFNLAKGVALGQAVEAVQRAELAMNAPVSLIRTFQGTAQAFQSSLKTQPYLIAAAVVVLYIILGMLYESYIHPLTILSTLPSAGVGALLILIASRHDLSVIALIGILLLIGIVKKNAIMMIDFALHAERGEGLSPEESIFQACLKRFRPIMMTTMAALLGGLPLMLGTGTGSELRQPLGYAIVGGLLLSQVLTLYTTPVVYLYMDRLSRWVTGARRAPRESTMQRMLNPRPAGGSD